MFDTYKGKNLQILSINCGESKSDVQKFITEKKIKYKVLLDSEGTVSGNYNVQYIPHVVLIDMKGKIIYMEAGGLPADDLINKAMKK